MNVVDSSGWLEFFANGPSAGSFAKPIETVEELLVPSVTLVEVFKRILQQRSEAQALQAVAHMTQGHVVALNTAVALKAARLGHDLKLPLADSVVLATARLFEAILWTQDEDFKGLPEVRFFPRR